MTVVGLLITGILNLVKLCAKAVRRDLKIKTHINGCSLITEVGGNWGGVELGAVALCGNYSETNSYWFEHTRRHEFGHALQNLILGPLFIFVVALPSGLRYNLRDFKTYNAKLAFCLILSSAVFTILSILLIVLWQYLAALIVFMIALAYWTGFSVWLCCIELPKYKVGIYDCRVAYDSIWFEGSATAWGTKYVDWLESK